MHGVVEISTGTEQEGVDCRLQPALGQAPNCLADVFPG
jgi:hypothetical protein